MEKLGTFRIPGEESLAFARASGDYNPLHLDPLAARRTQFGHTLIHGVCGTLRALDIALQHQTAPVTLRNLQVKYSKPVGQDVDITVYETACDSGRCLELFANDTRCQIIELDTGTIAATVPEPARRGDQPQTACRELDIRACEGLSDAVDLRPGTTELPALFPNVCRVLPAGQISSIIACTEIVGMRCPGLHSVFATLELLFPGVVDGSLSSLDFRVTASDSRINRVVMAVENGFTQGTIEAFFRPPPVQQAPLYAACDRVAAAEFENQTALVIGASRGLGEVIAKALAAGGARLMLTYASGAAEAESIAQEIGAIRERPATCQYDVLAPASSPAFDAFLSNASHIYYLASPLIRKGEPGGRDAALFQAYHRFYVDGLAALLERLRTQREANTPLAVFIPSSVFLESDIKGFGEYIEAKQAAESFVEGYAQEHPHTHFHAPRLPRLHTDQTSGVRGMDPMQTLEIIIDTLHTLYGRQAQPAKD